MQSKIDLVIIETQKTLGTALFTGLSWKMQRAGVGWALGKMKTVTESGQITVSGAPDLILPTIGQVLAKIGKLIEPRELDVPTAQVAVVLSSLLKGVCVITVTANSVTGGKTDLKIHGYSKHNLVANAARSGVEQVIRELESRYR